LANLFLHYSFDMWMARTYPHIPFERYADDVICHCKSVEEAQELWRALADRFAACKLVLHPEKTKIVYCQDANRRGDFPVIAFDFLGFQFRARKTMWRKGDKRIFAHSFQPAAIVPLNNPMNSRSLTRPSDLRAWQSIRWRTPALKQCCIAKCGGALKGGYPHRASAVSKPCVPHLPVMLEICCDMAPCHFRTLQCRKMETLFDHLIGSGEQ